MKKQKLFAPWRVAYVKKVREGDNECIFCEKPEEDNDEENLILKRGDHNFIILNKYPYNPGHAMVVPYRHESNYSKLEKEEVLEKHELLSKFLEAAKEVFDPDGFNIGINLGRTAGAGIDDHVHTHIVPRWEGDNNFMPVISNTRVISQSIESSYNELKKEIEDKKL
ncbi:HIT family hydrolase [archaeon SCG-AAA382B04]|nr:HIT family hydrolase [archaeon SCG-AAA382B04]